MSNLRLSTAIALGKATAGLSRLMRLGGGTTLPGRVARGVAPAVMSALAGRLAQGSVLITGTNGKTTTTRLIAQIAKEAGFVPVHNRAGANLAAGIAAALVEGASINGVPQGDIGVFEVDEATLPRIREALAPRVLVLTNLFRDQLDRYGEIDLVADRWRAVVATLPTDVPLVFNADDPLVADVAAQYPGPRWPFGIEDRTAALPAMEHAADARYCYRCGVPYRYEAVYFGHMGIYRCPSCGMARPTPVISARDVVRHGVDDTEFTMETPGGTVRVQIPLPGAYNIHNVLAAVGAALALDLPLTTIIRSLRSFAPAFGRAERISLNGHRAILLLAKNPAGFNEVIRVVISESTAPIPLMIAINDLTADGRDISWLWDVDFELLVGRVDSIVVSGLRAEDMALRLKHAGIRPTQMTVAPDVAQAFDRAVDMLSPGEPLYVLPTYTALLALRRELHRRGYVKDFWEH